MEPPHKRKRTNTLPTLPLTQSLPTTQLQNHRSLSPSLRRSHLWFDDGSVVLQAEGTLFKVHRTVLSRHSTVFRDMFSIPQPDVREEEKVDGCPVVVLSDSALDVGELVEVLYDKSYNVRESLPYPTLAAMLRLGRKYDIEHLVAEALVRLTSEFPTTLAEWEKLDEEFTHIRYQKGILFDLVNLAREMGVMSVLPAACYLCIQDLGELVNGQIRDDGTVARLPQHLQNTLTLAREQILHAQSTTTLSWVDATPTTCSKCLNPPACASARYLITKKIWKPFPDCSRGLERWSDVPSAGLCGSCVSVAREVHELGRRRMWELLPGFFGLGGWESLRNCED